MAIQAGTDAGNPQRVDVGAAVAAGGGLLLFVSLFLDWYGLHSAWTVFEIVDLVLAAIALAAVASFLARSGLVRQLPRVPLLALAALALVLVVSQLVNHPPAAQGIDPEVGAWLALAGAALMLAGALMSVARVSVAFSVEHRDAPGGAAPSDGPAAAPPPSPQQPGAASPPPPPPPSGAAAERDPETETVKLTDPDRPA